MKSEFSDFFRARLLPWRSTLRIFISSPREEREIAMQGSPSAESYLSSVLRIAGDAARSQRGNVEEAASAVANVLSSGGSWWVFGTGHSHMLAEELWGRAGGLADVRPILEPSLMLHEGLQKSSVLERQPGLAAALLSIHPVRNGDCLLIASNSGRNAVPVEMAELARERGVIVVAITSLAHSKAVTSRAPSGKRLFEVADIVIDNHGVPGDAITALETGAVGPTSTVIGAMLAQAISVEVIGTMHRQGTAIETLRSNNW